MENHNKKELSKVVLNAMDVYSGVTYERAFSDVKDSFKQSHRRILFSIMKAGCEKPNGKPAKSAKIIGECLPIHPHGDVALYKTVIKMAQEFNGYPYPLINGTGNFGIHSDPTSFASMRYTEARASEFAYDVIFKDYNSKIVDMKPSEDFGKMEPVWLSTRIPLLLVEGSEGIAEAFISYVPSHNLSDVVKMCINYINNPNIKNEDLVSGVFPDFPCGGTIINGKEVEEFYKYGTPCSIKMKGELEIDREKNIILVKEFPSGSYYRRFKEELFELAEKNSFHLSRISNIMNEKSKDYNNFYVAKIYCNKDANLYEIMNLILNKTSLKVTRRLSFRVFDSGIIREVSVKDIIANWYQTRSNYIQNEINYRKNELEVEVHILKGMLKIYDYTDEIIDLIRKSEDKDDAIEKVINKVPDLSKIQAKYIVEMQLHKLSKVSKSEIEKNIENNLKEIDNLYYKLTIIPKIIISQLIELDKKYHRPRRTEVLMQETDQIEKINFTNKVILYARNAYILFDIDSFLNSKNLLNGLINIKINNQNFKEMIGLDYLTKDIMGYGLFYSDGRYDFFQKDKITSTNHWMELQSNSESYVKKLIPLYDDNDYLLFVSNENKLRKVLVKEFKNKFSSISFKDVIYMSKDDTCSILAINQKGEYLFSMEDEDMTDYPITARKANGVNTKFDENDTIILSKINSDDHFLALFAYDSSSLQNYINIINIDDLIYNNRNNKLKQLNNLNNLELTCVKTINLPNKSKDYDTILISKNNSLRINSRNLKYLNEYRKIGLKVIDFIQFEKI